MADFSTVTASNDPRVNDHEAVQRILDRYVFAPDLEVGVGFEHECGSPYLFVYGYCWPEAWPLPDGMEARDFDPDEPEFCGLRPEGFEVFLTELAPYLQEPLIVQSIGAEKCRYPLSACQWRIRPGAATVEVSGLGHLAAVA